MSDGDTPELTQEEITDLLAHFTPEQVRLMASRWEELREALIRWMEQEEGNGDSIHFYRTKDGSR